MPMKDTINQDFLSASKKNNNQKCLEKESESQRAQWLICFVLFVFGVVIGVVLIMSLSLYTATTMS